MSILRALFLIAGSLYSILLPKASFPQTISSVTTDRFLFRLSAGVADSSTESISLPQWFSVPTERGMMQLGVVNRFGLLGLNEVWFGWMLGGSPGLFRLDAQTVGDVDYRHATVQVSFHKKLTETFWLGSGLGVDFRAARGYGVKGMPTASVSAGGWVGKRILWGSVWDNPQILLRRKVLEGPQIGRIRGAIVYRYTAAVEFSAGMGWESTGITSLFLRGSYKFSPIWRLALGYGWQPDQIVLSVQRTVHKGCIGFGFSQDPALGSSFSFQIGKVFNQKK